MREWQSKYSSFNSWKGLTYYQNYRQIVKWMEGDDYLPPPIECNLDPTAYCNLDCYFCIVQRYLKYNRNEIGTMLELPLSYTLRLAEFLADWGVRGFCISGGGEPSLYKGLPRLINHSAKMMDVSVFTNAILMPDELKQAYLRCKWLSLSIDSADRQTYRQIKGKDKFPEVISGLEKLVALRAKNKSQVWLVFKFLILPENQYQIYEACKLAKNIGLQAIHIRPADLQRKDMNTKSAHLNINAIYEQFERCHREETKDFQVFTVTLLTFPDQK